jgi:hypothetical protein
MSQKIFRRAGIPVFLIFLNLFLIWPWFQDGYPANPASIEPVIIAQARFLKNNWPNLGWNPYWYLGFPNRFIGSLFLPYLIALISSLFPKLSFWFIYRLMTGAALVIMPVGVYWLGRSFAFTAKRTNSSALRMNLSEASGLIGSLVFSFLPSLLFFFPQIFKIGLKVGFFPWQYFSLAYLGNGTKILGLAVLPFCLLKINRFLKGGLKSLFWPSLLVVFLALVDLSSVASLMILSVLLLAAYAMVGKIGKKIKKCLYIFIFSFLLLGVWYSPRFWFQAFSAPSLAGRGALAVGLFLTRIFSILVPIALAIASASFIKKKKDQFFFFGFLWVFVFSFLSLARFLADHDFWQDYSSWGIELGMGASLLTAYLLVNGFQFSIFNFQTNFKAKILNFKPEFVFLAFVTFICILLYLSNPKELLKPQKDIGQTAEARVVRELKARVGPGERVFVSGSPVFWLNSFLDLAQVRGGVDRGANHPFWDHASYQIRVGEDPELAREWLKALGVSWIVVHDPSSEEPYHDFLYPEKFQADDGFQKLFEEKGDVLYRIEAGIGRQLKNPEEFLKLKPPKDGADKQALESYNAFSDTLISLSWLNSNELIIQPETAEAIGLAITFDNCWQASQGSQKLRIEKDSLSQMVVFPQNREEKIKLGYCRFCPDQIIGLIISLAGIFAFSPRLRKKPR